LSAVAIALPPAVALGWCLARRSFPGKAAIEVLLNLPLVLPPVVTGYLLLVTFGRRGPVGAWLEEWLGLRFIFDWKGAVLAAAIVGFPLFVRPIRLAFASVDERLLQAARTLGATPADAFRSIALPLALPGILAGAVLAFARGLGEFGATIMIAGNIPAETQTVSLLIYSLLDAPGGIQAATPLVLVAVGIAAVALLAGEFLDRAQRRRLLGSGA
ncbi:MAG: molybdate ABC transporter permease subunit, partial [Planctomycetaceae bacterium]|nr:molybdate ABC transporter permease subunit [Planctomycetaceae bacterium]